jgi:hypothetical protein
LERKEKQEKAFEKQCDEAKALPTAFPFFIETFSG